MHRQPFRGFHPAAIVRYYLIVATEKQHVPTVCAFVLTTYEEHVSLQPISTAQQIPRRCEEYTLLEQRHPS
ncbi:hypothetical protein DdX_05320 [Ditylenchus destructor]|uniref:Uncharacterized protein n=1 Tax=Ditylenchus destructor TaxID=166010 RepID=A0AAD4N604_9BILA|nr:hypothetical protein DdX_05320 [Ditylenchus destructor]